MATIRKRNGRYQAQVRRKGYCPVSKTFTSITSAKKWIKATESDMERRLFEKGLNPVEVATITGHKDTKMLMRYTHLRAEDLVGRLG